MFSVDIQVLDDEATSLQHSANQRSYGSVSKDAEKQRKNQSSANHSYCQVMDGQGQNHGELFVLRSENTK